MKENFTFFSAYLVAQLILLPLVFYFLKLNYKKASVDLLRRTRTSVSLLTIILPLAIWFSATFVGQFDHTFFAHTFFLSTRSYM